MPHFIDLAKMESFIFVAILISSIIARSRGFSKTETDMQNLLTLTNLCLFFIVCPILYIKRTPKMKEYVLGKIFLIKIVNLKLIPSISSSLKDLRILKNKVEPWLNNNEINFCWIVILDCTKIVWEKYRTNFSELMSFDQLFLWFELLRIGVIIEGSWSIF